MPGLKKQGNMIFFLATWIQKIDFSLSTGPGPAKEIFVYSSYFRCIDGLTEESLLTVVKNEN